MKIAFATGDGNLKCIWYNWCVNIKNNKWIACFREISFPIVVTRDITWDHFKVPASQRKSECRQKNSNNHKDAIFFFFYNGCYGREYLNEIIKYKLRTDFTQLRAQHSASYSKTIWKFGNILQNKTERICQFVFKQTFWDI